MIAEHFLIRPHLLESGFDLEPRFVDEGAGALLPIDRSFVFEPAQRVSNSRPADPEFVGQLDLRRNPTFLERTGDNALLEVRFDLVGEGGAASDHEGTGSTSSDTVV